MNNVHGERQEGGRFPARMWHDFMTRADPYLNDNCDLAEVTDFPEGKDFSDEALPGGAIAGGGETPVTATVPDTPVTVTVPPVTEPPVTTPPTTTPVTTPPTTVVAPGGVGIGTGEDAGDERSPPAGGAGAGP